MHLVATEQPDMIVTDIHLAGGGDGLRVAREAHERYGARTVVITGHRDGDSFLRAEESGAEAFLRKPFGLSRSREPVFPLLTVRDALPRG